jgi:acetyltransferase-like isoleucine patch superfamily enzyme
MFIKIFVLLFPWSLRRRLLARLFGYEIHPSARIGWAWIYPKHLRMGSHAKIGHFSVAIHLDAIEMGDYATIGRSNWITGYPSDSKKHFSHQTDRRPRLVMGDHCAVTNGHHIDCTHEIRIGQFTTVAGYQSQFLTHSIDLVAGRQHSEPIEIGEYCFVSTRCILLGGSRLPARSVLAAGAVLTNAYDTSFSLYGGVPARLIKEMSGSPAYFNRTQGFVI